MKFLLEDLQDTVLNGWSHGASDLYEIESPKWTQGSHDSYQERTVIFMHGGKHYACKGKRIERSYGWEEQYVADSDGYIECEEVEKVEVASHIWKAVK